MDGYIINGYGKTPEELNNVFVGPSSILGDTDENNVDDIEVVEIEDLSESYEKIINNNSKFFNTNKGLVEASLNNGNIEIKDFINESLINTIKEKEEFNKYMNEIKAKEIDINKFIK